MSLRVSTIAGVGDIEKERVVLRVLEDTDLGRWALFGAHRGEGLGVLSGDVPNTYWFPGQTVKKNDYVVLYTKNGPRSKKLAEDGPSSYFYYWRRADCVWVPKMIAVAVNTPRWTIYNEEAPEADAP